MFGINRFRLGALGGSSTRKPTLNLNFIGSASLDSRITFTRASSATYFDSTGALQTASNDVARLDCNPSTLAPRGLLIEEQRTNSIRNNSAGGATVGVIGSGGVLPTNWVVNSAASGVTREVVGTGTENGISYVDLRFSGTPTTTGALSIQQETNNTISGSNGQSWTYSVWVKREAGSYSNLSAPVLYHDEYSSTPSFLAGSTTSLSAPSTTLTRATGTRTNTNASTAFVIAGYRMFVTTANIAIDITVRIGFPQLEQGAFVTSVIPTTGSSATRNADAASMTGTNFSSWYNATEGTLFAEASPLIAPLLSPGRPVFFLTNGTTSSIDIRFRPTQKAGMAVIDAGSTQVDSASTGNYSTSINKLAGAYLVNNFASTLNAESPVVDTSGTVPSSLSSAFIASDGTNRFNGYIRRIAYYPRRLANAELQSITS